jgi:hypothetical protein
VPPGAGVRSSGNKGAWAELTLLFIEDLDGLLPGSALGFIDLAQVENVTLHHGATDAAAFHDGP